MIGGVKQASVRWARWERNTTRGWRERVVYSMGTIYHTKGLANGPGKRPHSLPVVSSSAPYNSASSASYKILIQQAYYFLLMYRQHTASHGPFVSQALFVCTGGACCEKGCNPFVSFYKFI